MILRFVASVYRQPEFGAKNVQWFWMGYGRTYWRPSGTGGQLPTTQIFELLRKYL